MDQFLWVEKYRPHKIDDCVLPQTLKDTFNKFIAAGEIQNMTLVGSAGVGKTTVAKALCEQLGCDYLFINGSEESGIDTIRNKVRQFASTVSLAEMPKVVILDEADYLNPNSTQPALRGFIEEFEKNCRFILTCNFKNKLIEPLLSRALPIEFSIRKEDKKEMAAGIFKRIKMILETEGVKYDKDSVVALIVKFFPDYRRIINELQRYSVAGIIDQGILVNIAEINIQNLIAALKAQNFGDMRKWVATNLDNDPNILIRKLFDSAAAYVEPQMVPVLILILANYQYKAAFVADHELNTTAMLTEIMADVQFK